MGFKFDNNTNEIIKKLQDQAIKFLHEAGGEIHAQVVRNTDTHSKEGQLKTSWKYIVDESDLKVTIGSPLENAIWEEFGTGEYATKGNGRKGYWVFVKNGTTHSQSPKTYTLEEAKRIMAIMRSQGLEAFYTRGKQPRHNLQKAWETKIPACKKRLKQLMNEVGK